MLFEINLDFFHQYFPKKHAYLLIYVYRPVSLDVKVTDVLEVSRMNRLLYTRDYTKTVHSVCVIFKFLYLGNLSISFPVMMHFLPVSQLCWLKYKAIKVIWWRLWSEPVPYSVKTQGTVVSLTHLKNRGYRRISNRPQMQLGFILFRLFKLLIGFCMWRVLKCWMQSTTLNNGLVYCFGFLSFSLYGSILAYNNSSVSRSTCNMQDVCKAPYWSYKPEYLMSALYKGQVKAVFKKNHWTFLIDTLIIQVEEDLFIFW